MRAKHLLMTTALTAALFTACSNDDFLDNAQGNLNNEAAMRPTVEKVVMNLVEGNNDAVTRLGFNGKYQWEQNDTIGALLMDALHTAIRPSDDGWKDLTWVERYKLTDYINTDYPFIRQEDGTWTTNAKMLEGNYFFSFPYASYSGNREAVHSLAKQVQDGVSKEATMKAYAKNQFFVGYARIHAGTEGGDVMNAELNMTPILGAVGITVKNIGSAPFTVKKIVLTSTDFSTLIKINPTEADYKGIDGSGSFSFDGNNAPLGSGWTAWTNGATNFNYANYEEMHQEGNAWAYNEKFEEEYVLGKGFLVNNTEKSANYDRDDALRAVVNKMGDDNRAELTVVNAPAIKNLESQNFVIMTNAYKYTSATNAVKATVYTDQGMIKDVTISNVKGEVGVGDGVTVITENPIVEIAPDLTNVVTLQIDMNSVQEPDEMDLYNASDLQQFIEWQKGLRRPATATLKNDIEMTKAMTDMLTAADWANVNLIIENSGKKLIVEKDAAANILDYVLVNGEVEVHNDMVIGSKSYLKGTYEKYAKDVNLTNNKLTVAEGASLTVNSDITTAANKETQGLVVENNGTFAINAAVTALTIDNFAEMTIAGKVELDATSTNNADAVLTITASGELKAGGKLTNQGTSDKKYAVINNNGKVYNLENGSYGKVIVGEDAAIITNLNNNDVIGVVDITANIKANLNKHVGIIAYTLTDEKSMKDIKDAKITALTIDGGKVTSSSTTSAVNAVVTKIVVTENGGSIAGTSTTADQFSTADMEINGDLALENIALGGNIDIKAGTTSIEGTVDATGQTITLGSYDKESYKAKTGTLRVVSASDKLIVNSIEKNADSKVTKAMAQVENQGKIVVKIANQTNVTWNGNNETIDSSTPPVTPTDVTVGSGTYTTLKALYEAVQSGTVVIKDKITIDRALALSTTKENDADYRYLKALATGKEVVLAADLTALTADMGLSFGKLTVTFPATVSGDPSQPTVTILSVNSLDYTAAKLTVTNGYIKISGEGQIGDGSTSIKGTSSNLDVIGGKVVTTNQDKTAGANALVQWDATTSKWKALN